MTNLEPSEILWGKQPYSYPGKNLGSGNRCGHEPTAPAFHLFTPKTTQKERPSTIQKLIDGAKAYYYSPWSLPTLTNLSGKTNQDGQPRPCAEIAICWPLKVNCYAR